MAAPAWLRNAVHRVEDAEPIDRNVALMEPVAGRLADGPAGDALRGQWLGHALHPLATDMPLGCWIGSGLLDLVGGRRGRRASQRLVGLGLLFVPITAASGMVDWSDVDDRRTKRVGAVHAMGNTVVAMLYLLSWRSRRRGHHLRGVVQGLAGGSLAWVTGYLGGHMSFGRGAGVGERGLEEHDERAASTARTGPTPGAFGGTDLHDLVDVREAAELLTVQPEQVHAMVEEGILTPTTSDAGSLRFERADVLAVRLIGG